MDSIIAPSRIVQRLEPRFQPFVFKHAVHDLGPDIYEPLFDGIFNDKGVFHLWQQKSTKWQLRCHGGPGSGKTTFAQLAEKRLRELHKSDRRAIISIFIKSLKRPKRHDLAVPATIPAVLEDILWQLCSQDLDESCDHGDKLTRASSNERLRLAILHHIQNLDQTFLIVDGIHCLPGLDSGSSDLEQEICWLQAQAPGRLNVLLTSRGFPIPDEELFCFINMTSCDGNEDTEGHDNAKELPDFWLCRKHDTFALCRACYERNPIPCKDCPKNEEPDFWQPYQHRYIDLNRDLGTKDEDFYPSWSMNAEQGNPIDFDGPHGRPDVDALANQPNTDVLESLSAARFQSEGNIALMRAYMEMIHTGYGPWRDGLPDPLVAMFENVLLSIRDQVDEALSIVGLWSLNVVSKLLDPEKGPLDGDGDADQKKPDSVSWEEVQAALVVHMPKDQDKYSIRYVLQAAHGVLLVNSDDKLLVRFYNKGFRAFIHDKRQELGWGLRQVRRGSVGK